MYFAFREDSVKGPPVCPHCDSTHIAKRTETELGRIGRWQWHDYTATFKVTCGTVFHGTKVPLQKWFLAISLVLNAKKSVSSYQLARDLDLNQKTAWHLLTCIRAEMMKKGGALLQGPIEADETYIGGKPRKPNKKADAEPAKRERGTEKTAILGAVERGGKVAAKVLCEIPSRSVHIFLDSTIRHITFQIQYSQHVKCPLGNFNRTF